MKRFSTTLSRPVRLHRVRARYQLPFLGRLVLMLTLLSVGQATGQTNSGNPAAPGIANRPVIVPSKGRKQDPPRPNRPPAPGEPVQTQGIHDLVRQFQAARKSYVQQQEDLRREMKEATKEQRAKIREQLQDNLKEWRERQLEQMKELRQQAKEIKEKVPNLRDVIDAGSGEGRPGR